MKLFTDAELAEVLGAARAEERARAAAFLRRAAARIGERPGGGPIGFALVRSAQLVETGAYWDEEEEPRA